MTFFKKKIKFRIHESYDRSFGETLFMIQYTSYYIILPLKDNKWFNYIRDGRAVAYDTLQSAKREVDFIIEHDLMKEKYHYL